MLFFKWFDYIMNLTIAIKSYLNPNKVPDFFGIKPFVVNVGSMETEIMAGDLVITKNVDPAKLEKGDIISFKDGNAVITHRIHEVKEENGETVFYYQGRRLPNIRLSLNPGRQHQAAVLSYHS